MNNKMGKQTRNFILKDCGDYECYIDMSVDEAIKLIDNFLKKTPSGKCSLDMLARRRAIDIVVEELKKMKREFS